MALPKAIKIDGCPLQILNGFYEFDFPGQYVKHRIEGQPECFLRKRSGDAWVVSKGNENLVWADKVTKLPLNVSWSYVKGKGLSSCNEMSVYPVPISAVPQKSPSPTTSAKRSTKKPKLPVRDAEDTFVKAVNGKKTIATKPPFKPSSPHPDLSPTKQKSRPPSQASMAVSSPNSRTSSPSQKSPQSNKGVEVEVAVVSVPSVQGAVFSVTVPQRYSDQLGKVPTIELVLREQAQLEERWGSTVAALLREVEACQEEVHRLNDVGNNGARPSSEVAALTAERNSLAQQLAQLRLDLQDVRSRLEAASAKNADLLLQLGSAEDRYAACGEEKDALTAQLSAASANLRVTRAQAEEAALKATSLSSRNKEVEAELQRLTESHAGISAALTSASAKLAAVTDEKNRVQSQADTLIQRSGQNHIKRDRERLLTAGTFPTGCDLRESFVATFLNFESFACDAIFALENLGHSEAAAAGVFVAQVMLPLYAGCKGYVDAQLQVRREEMQKTFGMALPDDLTNDSVPKLFWFLSLQAHLPTLVKALSDGDIEALIAATDRDHAGVLGAVHARMLEDARAGLISDSDSDLRMPQLVRALLLLLFTHAALSDPNCYLQPAPGTQLAYHPDRCKEILSPGAKKHGLIKEGDTVEVVLPGLYFLADGAGDAPGTVKLVIPSLVRRTLVTFDAAPVSPEEEQS